MKDMNTLEQYWNSIRDTNMKSGSLHTYTSDGHNLHMYTSDGHNLHMYTSDGHNLHMYTSVGHNLHMYTSVGRNLSIIASSKTCRWEITMIWRNKEMKRTPIGKIFWSTLYCTTCSAQSALSHLNHLLARMTVPYNFLSFTESLENPDVSARYSRIFRRQQPVTPLELRS
jgi:hypothetical protein